MIKTKEPLSTCCNAPLKIGGNDSEESPEGQTHYYVCSKCGKECSAVAKVKEEKEIKRCEQCGKIIKGRFITGYEGQDNPIIVGKKFCNMECCDNYLKGQFELKQEGKKEPYKRECNHGKELHWKECPECREYMVRKEYETPKPEEIRQSPMSKEDIADMVKIAKMNQPEETEEWKEEIKTPIELAIKEFERLKNKSFSLKDSIYLDAVLAVLDGFKVKEKKYIQSLLSQKDKEWREKIEKAKCQNPYGIEHPYFERGEEDVRIVNQALEALLKPTK